MDMVSAAWQAALWDNSLSVSISLSLSACVCLPVRYVASLEPFQGQSPTFSWLMVIMGIKTQS